MHLRFVLVDARPTARAALREVVETEWGWTVVAEALDGIEAVRRVREGGVDVMLVDASVEGIELSSLFDLMDEADGPLVVGLLDFPHQYAAARGVAVLKGAPSDHVRSVILDSLATKKAVAQADDADRKDEGGQDDAS